MIGETQKIFILLVSERDCGNIHFTIGRPRGWNQALFTCCWQTKGWNQAIFILSLVSDKGHVANIHDFVLLDDVMTCVSLELYKFGMYRGHAMGLPNIYRYQTILVGCW